MDFTNIDNLISNVLSLLTVPKPKNPDVSPFIVLASQKRSGMSAQKIAAEIISRRPEAGLPVGQFADGQQNPDELMEIIRAEVYMNALSTEARTTVAIQPGISIMAQGSTASGVPVIVKGITTSIGKGNAIIQ